jgi:hypothetical protein
VNVVFNNAGIIRRTTAVETTVEEWDRVFGRERAAIFLMCKHVVPIMAAAGGGSIVQHRVRLGPEGRRPGDLVLRLEGRRREHDARAGDRPRTAGDPRATR